MDLSFVILSIEVILIISTRAFEFGLYVPISSISYESTNTVTTTIIWNSTYLIQCSFIPSAQGQWHSCSNSLININENANNCNELSDSTVTSLLQLSDNVIHLDLSGTNGLWVDKIRITDNNQNEFVYETFCSSLSFTIPPETQSSSNCVEFDQYKKWTYFCMDGDGNCNSYDSIDIILPSDLAMDEALISLSNQQIIPIDCTVSPSYVNI